ncbi:MAG: RimK family alpha-L-glutamate ligase [Desulfobacterales bacterium]|nr:RimK family alpha-L-glutamate ligase [Desulfobacterales bacterium]MDX2511561.1 RimK family alpha-L-glutamate ligase [Desulfobacterales bacterium]
MNENRHIALESRLSHCNNVITLGVKPNLEDYSDEAMALIRNAKKIYYPSSFHAELFHAMGKETFPSPHNYQFAQDKIKQTAIFKLLDIPHPRTRVYYGKHQKASILDRFQFPFIAKIPRGSAMGRGVFLIQNQTDLHRYLSLGTPAYIQEYLPLDRDMRIVVIGKEIAHAYWRITATGEFRSNVAAGASISLEPVPGEALALALHTAEVCCWNDVGIDICSHSGKLYVLEANMKYGKEGFRTAGIDYADMMAHKIATGAI